MDPSTLRLKRMIHAALMAALTAAGAYIAIPVGPVPIVLQNLFVLLAGLLLGSRWGLISMGIYLLSGIMGLPVFAGGTGGVGKFFGPTGGYLIAYPMVACLVGLIAEKGKHRIAADIVAVTAGMMLTYAIGVPWLKMVTGMTLTKAVAVGLVPFIPGCLVKIAAAVCIARSLRPLVNLS
ncbi:biotin transporter BioY, partial [Desulfosarcina sp. OttesenSCG-928-B08]|nr:biotin transporter BioY [Desulfosarcina sp. OttesenSCG-928-B08]